MLSGSNSPADPPDAICKSLLQVLNTWDASCQHDADRLLDPLTRDLTPSVAQLSTDTKEEKQSIYTMITAVQAAVRCVREREKGAAEQAVVCVGALLARLSKNAPPTCRRGPHKPGPRPRTVFIRHDGVTRRVQCPADSPPLTASALRELIETRFPKIRMVDTQHDSALPAVDVRDPCSGIWYRLEDVDDLTDGSLLRVSQDSDDAAHERGLPSAHPPTPSHEQQPIIGNTSDTHIHKTPQPHKKPPAPQPPRTTSTSAQTDDTPPPPPHSSPLDAITAEISDITTATTSIEDRLNHFREIIDALASDAAARGVSAHAPASAHLAALRADANALNADIAQRRATLDRARPRWKAAWARGLEDIVAQQTALSRHESLAVELDAARTEVAETVEKVLSVAEMLEKRRKDAADTTAFVPAVLTAEEVESARLTPVLDELKLAIVAKAGGTIDRLEGVERWAEIRQWKLQAEREHGENLLKWIRQAVLKETGGVERVEQARAEKDAEHRRAVMSN
ncbi:Bud site selection protein 6 [Geranomyces variabilis]|nr:Bud site selection protein 6 [Geranomyces variabilis]